MNTIKNSIFGCLLAATALAGCGHSGYKKTSTGMVYDIISDGKDSLIKHGDFLKIHYKFVLNEDSILESTFGRIPAYGAADTSKLNLHNFTDLLPLLRVGDSLECVRFVDTLRKMGQIPPGDTTMKPGATIKAYVKVLKRFKNEADLQTDYLQEEDKELQREITGIKAYLKDNKISAEQTPKGVFVQVTNPGNGMQVDTGTSIAVMYRGKTLAGQMFDSNMDAQFNHKGQPFEFVVGASQVIPGWDEGLKKFKQGGKGKLYIPAMLAYKNRPASEIIKPYTDLVFDVEVVSVKVAPPQAQQQGQPPMQ
jgi:FKBP-type peptidyl-prolyl cis-trans isomerase FkpA